MKTSSKLIHVIILSLLVLSPIIILLIYEIHFRGGKLFDYIDISEQQIELIEMKYSTKTGHELGIIFEKDNPGFEMLIEYINQPIQEETIPYYVKDPLVLIIYLQDGDNICLNIAYLENGMSSDSVFCVILNSKLYRISTNSLVLSPNSNPKRDALYSVFEDYFTHSNQYRVRITHPGLDLESAKKLLSVTSGLKNKQSYTIPTIMQLYEKSDYVWIATVISIPEEDVTKSPIDDYAIVKSSTIYVKVLKDLSENTFSNTIVKINGPFVLPGFQKYYSLGSSQTCLNLDDTVLLFLKEQDGKLWVVDAFIGVLVLENGKYHPLVNLSSDVYPDVTPLFP